MRSLLVSTLCLLSLACGPAPAKAPPLQSLGTALQGDVSVELLAREGLHVGQNRVFYRVKDGDALAPHAELSQKPLMTMATMKHGCPVVNPDHMANDDGLFEGLLVFTMASTDMETWGLSMDALLSHDASPVALDFGTLAVADSTYKKVVTRGADKLILTLGFPDAPKVGANPVLVTAHVATDMMKMTYATVDDLTLSLVTEMPSMGHGASGNVSPTRGDDGLYRGTAVFSMSGDWVVHLGLKAGEVDLGTYDFALDL